jgi:ATP-dependent DNA helicase RecG
MPSYLDNDVQYLAGVGEARATLLEKELNIKTLGDLLYHFPFRYIDRTKVYKIGEITEDNADVFMQIRARVLSKNIFGTGRAKRLVVGVGDGTGTTEMVWFRGTKWIEKTIEMGREYVFFGRPSFFRGEFNMAHPEIEPLNGPEKRINSSLQGVYNSTEALSAKHLGSKGLYNLMCSLWPMAEPGLQETLPAELMRRHNLISRKEALFNIHFPQSPALLKAAEYRLKFEELLGIQLDIQSKRSVRIAKANGFLMPKVGELFNRFYNEKLPFELTGAQKRVIKEIHRDMVSGKQMNRLLQGDVGSGKTLVALAAMLLAVDNGFQACMMAPTEILARQHFTSLSRQTEGLGVTIAILTGATRAAERRTILEGIENGSINMLIGTHALIEDPVQFANLGLVIIDEQHRFGVEQRARLWTKNSQPPHVLVMTATPIPRTLAMTLYGDLDVSIIDELPPGRRPIRTFLRRDSDRLAVWGFLRKEIAKGRQVYVVYPLIHESEKMDYKDLHDGFESITRDFPRPDYQVTAVHGKMRPDDKQLAMNEFKSGLANIMVATSVIEVGVDVPNATVMVIESAERFGLSQLHQLRGRVGRGGEQSYCILMSGVKLSKEASQRLQAMVDTNDGFELAEMDLRLRGSGDLAGTQQSGMAFALKISDLSRDAQLVEYTRDLAEAILTADPLLEKPENELLVELRARFSPHSPKDFSNIS